MPFQNSLSRGRLEQAYAFVWRIFDHISSIRLETELRSETVNLAALHNGNNNGSNIFNLFFGVVKSFESILNEGFLAFLS